MEKFSAKILINQKERTISITLSKDLNLSAIEMPELISIACTCNAKYQFCQSTAVFKVTCHTDTDVEELKKEYNVYFNEK